MSFARDIPRVVVGVAHIPTLSALYSTYNLRPADTAFYEPSQMMNSKVSCVRGDITTLEVDAIVNAANEGLCGGGGVDGAIHGAAGSALLDECRMLNGCKTGSAKITLAYKLPCKRVIHAVGPEYESSQISAPLLQGCYQKSLELAVQSQCKSIAFSAISTGVYGYPSTEAANIAISEVRKFLEGKDGEKIERVIFVTFRQQDKQAYHDTLPKYFPPAAEEGSTSQSTVGVTASTQKSNGETHTAAPETAPTHSQIESESFVAPPFGTPTTQPTSLEEP